MNLAQPRRRLASSRARNLRRASVAPVLLFLLGFGVAALGIATAADAAPTKGRIPDEAFLSNGDIDSNRVPLFVAVWGRDETIAGYVPREYILGLPDAPNWPVYGDDLKTIVGHMFPDRGFVPLGVDPESIPRASAIVGTEE